MLHGRRKRLFGLRRLAVLDDVRVEQLLGKVHLDQAVKPEQHAAQCALVADRQRASFDNCGQPDELRHIGANLVVFLAQWSGRVAVLHHPLELREECALGRAHVRHQLLHKELRCLVNHGPELIESSAIHEIGNVRHSIDIAPDALVMLLNNERGMDERGWHGKSP